MKKLIVLFSVLLLGSGLWAQDKSITGKVTDETGEALPGVNVMLKGTMIGTVTTPDGTFALQVPQDASKLLISFIGFISQEVDITNTSQVSVVLKSDVIGLGEVVAVGYGTQRKVDLTGSVAQVSGKKLKAAPTPNLNQNLAGKLTGVISSQHSGTPGFETSDLVIRGRGTVNGTGPLVLVDGVPRDWNRLDPNEIESMTVLKDAASTAVYGARAANGVILITTKRGDEGKPTIEYSGSTGFQKPTVLLDMLNAYEYAKYSNEAKLNKNDGNSDNLVLFSDDVIEKYRSGALGSTDWVDETFDNNATTQSHNLSLTGGQEKAKYFMSLGMMDQDGLYQQSYFKRYNARLNVDAKVNNSISVGMDLAARTEEANKAPGTDDGLWQNVVNNLPTAPSSVPNEIAEDALPFAGFLGNPVGKANRSGYQNVQRTYIESSFKVNIDIPWVKGLSALGRYSFDKNFKYDKTFTKGYDVYQYFPDSESWDLLPSNEETSLDEYKQDYTRDMLQASLNYKRSFGSHNLSGLALFERESTNSNRLQAERTGFISREVDYLFAGNLDQINNNGQAWVTAREGYVGRVNYNYASKYYIQVNARYDGSYKFARGSRFGLFPSVSGSWRMSEENFMDGYDWLDQLKIRGSYGKLGNDNIDPFQHLGLYGFDSGKGYIIGGNYILPLTESVAANEDVTWETTTTYNAGMDLSIYNGKFSLEADYFVKHTTDMLIANEAQVPASAGIRLPNVNLGEVDVKGFEIIARHRNEVNNVKYTIEGNITYAKDEIVFIDEQENMLAARKREGKPINQSFGYESDGLFQSQEEIDNYLLDQDGQGNASLRPGDIKYVDQNGDKKLDSKDEVAIGKPIMPQVIYGINLSASYKGFSVDANFQGASSFSRRVNLRTPFSLDANTITEVVENSWSESNRDAKYPRLVYEGAKNNTVDSDFWMRDASYIRLKNLELSYSFKQSALKTVGVQNLRLFISGTNLLTFSKTKYEDPEIYNTYAHLGFAPLMKSYTVGVNISF